MRKQTDHRENGFLVRLANPLYITGSDSPGRHHSRHVFLDVLGAHRFTRDQVIARVDLAGEMSPLLERMARKVKLAGGQLFIPN